MLRSQRMAHAAYDGVLSRSRGEGNYLKEYRSVARDFPALVHQCGLAQAVAFALAKKAHHADYVNDLATVLKAADHKGVANSQNLAEQTYSLPTPGYIRLSRDALDAAVWLKRYVETLFPEKPTSESKQEGIG